MRKPIEFSGFSRHGRPRGGFWARAPSLAPPGVPPGLLPRVPPRGIPAPAPQSSPQGSPEDAPARGARFCARALPGYCFSGPLPPTAHAVAGFARAHTLRAPAIEMGTRSPTPARHSGRHPRGMRTLKTREVRSDRSAARSDRRERRRGAEGAEHLASSERGSNMEVKVRLQVEVKANVKPT